MATYVKEQVLKYVGGSRTPVEGGSWAPLSPDYAALKKKIAGNRKANLELGGDMMDALDVKKKGSTKLSLEIAGKQAPKADGHNNFSGDSELPERNFIPDEDRSQTFVPSIWTGVKKILEGYSDGD
ncbi:MAG: hypothetical protein HOO67_03365 [Candidatus Peribacteraceae bacterium]|nr:hypothetical protein [Candidatus Peribacteraceae bacterium]